MRAVLQRVSRAEVRVEGKPTGAIGKGFLVLAAATHDDDQDAVLWVARKIAELRVFPDESGRMNRDVRQAGGAALVVPQFTLYGDTRRGRRPDFTAAARPEQAAPLLERLCEALEREGVPVERGVFGAHMEVELVNDGPVTVTVESPARGAGAP